MLLKLYYIQIENPAFFWKLLIHFLHFYLFLNFIPLIYKYEDSCEWSDMDEDNSKRTFSTTYLTVLLLILF